MIKTKFFTRLNALEDPITVAKEEMLKWIEVTEIGADGNKKKVINKELER